MSIEDARFKVVHDASHGCCNQASVIDTAIPVNASTGNYTAEAQICECREIDSAEKIASALNRSMAQ